MTDADRFVRQEDVLLAHAFPGDSEMARRMRDVDWSTTLLGPVDRWPQALRTAVSTSLNCAFPILVLWGPELALLYNDEYRAILGPAKHPAALGERGAKVWAEVWDVIAPMVAQVMEKADATRSRDFLLHIDREGYPEEAYFSFSFAPILDEGGRVGGIFCPVIETTEKVIGERRLRTLRDLASACTGAETEAAVYEVAARVLADNPHDIPFALIYRVDESGSSARLDATAGIERGSMGAPVEVTFGDDEPWIWSLARVARSGMAALISGLSTHFDRLPTGAWKVSPHSALVMPISMPGRERPRAVLVAAASPMGALDDDLCTFFSLVATQIASGLADTRAREEERRRAEALADLDRAKTEFFSNVSHEFRTPLTLMMGPLQDVLSNAHGSLPAEAATTLDLAYRNGLRLLRLVNSLLDFSRIEAGRIDASYEATDVAALTIELASVFRSAVEKAGLRLTVDCPPLSEPAFLDRDMWEKIVLNLLSNALKFTFEGEIRVVLREHDGRFELDIGDTGVGIPSESLPQMFQRFHRVRNARSRTYEGTGIGLALVQELAKLHGGNVEVTSLEGQGTTFKVGIPMGTSHLPSERVRRADQGAPADEGFASAEEASRWLPVAVPHRGPSEQSLVVDISETTPPPPRVSTGRPRARILLVDDNSDMRDYLRRLLSRSFDVIEVENGSLALDRIQTAPPDLVVTDVMMPRLDGFALVAAIRADARTRTLPIIMLSARAGEESRIDGLAAGADDYVVKPFSARELLARVNSQLALARVRREAELALRHRGEQFETLLNEAPLGVYLVDADFRIRAVNPVARPVFGDIAGGVVGRDFDEIIHIIWEKDYADEIVSTFRRTLETGEPYFTPERAEPRLDRGITEYYEWRLTRITLPDGRYGLVCYFRDISAQVLARKALEESRFALEEADRRKDEFLATLAHELRNPLAPIRNSLHVLRLAGGDTTAREYVREMMDRQVDYMVRLVDDLMEISRITRGTIELRKERVLLETVIRGALETSKPFIDAGHHQLSVSLPSEPLHLHADPTRLAQVLANLINNAAKYTQDEGKIWLCVQRSGPDVLITVRDNGIGIPPAMLGTVFDLFMQLKRTDSHAQSGLGIGLTLVRSLVRMHGGSVDAHSEGPGRGSEFIVRLPLAPSQVTEQRASSPPVAALAKRILVVDDNRDAADSLTTLLELLGAEVQIAHDGRTALDALQEFRPSVVFLDIGMPGMDGHEVARRARQLIGNEDVTIIALTGFGQEEDHRKSKEAGMDHHLVKPLNLAVLQQVLASRATLEVDGAPQ